MRSTAKSIWAPIKFLAAIPCELDKVRPVAREVRNFLLEQGLTKDETMGCELALVEACNNAVLYASDSGAGFPVEVEVICDDSHIQLRVMDHTRGFQLPPEFNLPDHEDEGGR